MSDLFLSVDPDLDAAPFAQIVDQLRAFIERGDLRGGDALPTVRQLAADLGVAPNTVARAYRELQEEGWLTGDGRRGTRVALHTPASDKRTRARTLREAVDRFMATMIHRGFSPDEVTSAVQRLVNT